MNSAAENESAPAPRIENSQVAILLEQMAELLEFTDENMFKVRSYRTAADAVKDLDVPIADIAQNGGVADLQKIPGIGKSIGAQIFEIVQTGAAPLLETLKQHTPLTVLDLRKVSGIGLKTAQALFRDFGIKSLSELKVFADGGGLRSVPGLGEKTTERVLRSLDRLLPQADQT